MKDAMPIESFPALELANRSLRFTILGGGMYRGDPGWNRDDVCDPYNRLYLVQAGGGWCERADGERHRIRPLWASLIPSGAKWNYRCDLSFLKFWIHFRLEPWPGHDLYENSAPFQERRLESGVLARLIKRASSGQLGELLACEADLRGIAAGFVTMNASQLERDLRIAKTYAPIFEAAEAGRYTGLRLGDLARGMNRSLSALSHAFRRDTGVTITRYLQDRMLQRARDRLLFTNDKIRVIARDLGYEDEFYFSRLFRKETGQPPLEFRKRNRYW